MALKTHLTYSAAWVSTQGQSELPATVGTESEARENLQVQHTEARDKLNEVLDAIETSISDSDEKLPTSKAVGTALSGKANTSHTHTVSQITNFPTLATVATSGSYNDLSDKPAAITVDSALSSSSTNPVQNKVISTALDGKLGTSAVSGTSGKIAKFTGANAVGDAFTLTISTSDPSGGSNGDIWIKYS